jgi:hypothetical protein
MKYQEKNTIYITRMPKRSTKEDVVNACKTHGNVNSCVFLHPKAKGPYAIVAFAEENGYLSAIRDGLTFGTKTIAVVPYVRK